ncbi:MAG TPA: class I SAM-dependent methyltransferase [Dehalococcoidia bacterium]|nr:class I SAM-dependent methyltransferase [Dehalococcoidia bacterium]
MSAEASQGSGQNGAEAEAERLRAAYARRAELGLDARYEYWQPANLFIYQARERALLAHLRKANLLPLTGRRVLDVGCGDGFVLRELQRYGANQRDLDGIDLLPDRVESARALLPWAKIDVGDAQSLPYEDETFDLVLGFTLLSSVVDPEARKKVAGEMRRVTKRGGCVVVYDFRLNPFNRDVRSVKTAELRELFEGSHVAITSTTLAPPLLRALVRPPGGWFACSALDMLPFLRTHFVAAVHV